MFVKRFFLIFLTTIAIISLVAYYKSLEDDSEITKYETLRQILHFRYDSQEVVTITPKIYIPPINNNTGNVPDVYLDDKMKRPRDFNKTCAKFPTFFSLKFQNDYWQVQKTSKGVLHLLNAYIDQRNGSVVRIVGTYDVYGTTDYLWCQLWYSDSRQPKIVQSQMPFWMFHKGWGADKGYFDHPYLITCPLVLDKDQFPVSVSLVDEPCVTATNNLKLFHKKVEEKKNFVVCVKGLSFPYEDKSFRLTEWIELINILGAEKINFYEFSVHPNTQRVLDYYVEQGLVEVTPLTIVGDYSNTPVLQTKFLKKLITPRRLQEVIPYTDCLYKHLQEFKYVVLLDTDEVIVPAEGTWVELLKTLEETVPNVSSFLARNVYFLDEHLHQHGWYEDIPRYMHMLQHVTRAREYTKPGYFVKGFHNTSRVIALHNHFPFQCYKSCSSREINISLAHLQHYRADCASGVSDCQAMKKESVVDSRIWTYKDELIKRVQRTLEKLDILNT